jgi:hypothetical protein
MADDGSGIGAAPSVPKRTATFVMPWFVAR